MIDADPTLAEKKIRKILVVAGDAAPGADPEYNVAQDPRAFVSVMTSGLPIRWAPAFDGGLWQAGTSSFTVSTDERLLRGVSPEVKAWFDQYIGKRYGTRNLWAAGLLSMKSPPGARWVQARLRFGGDGVVDPQGDSTANVTRLVVDDRDRFESAVVEATNDALRSLGQSRDP